MCVLWCLIFLRRSCFKRKKIRKIQNFNHFTYLFASPKICTSYKLSVRFCVMFNKRAGGFYRGRKPRGEAKWPYTPIKPDPRVYWTTSKTFREKRVSMELITMTLLWTLEISIQKKHHVWNYYVRKSNLIRVSKLSSLRTTLTEEDIASCSRAFRKPKNAEEERKLIESGTPKSTIPLKKYSLRRFFWNGRMVCKQKSSTRALRIHNWQVLSVRLRANGRNNSQHCSANNVGSRCVCVGSSVQTDITTPINIGTCSALWEGYNP